MKKMDDDINRVKADRAALMRLCDEQRVKIQRQAAEINRLKARVERMQSTIDELAWTNKGEITDGEK